MPSQDGLGGGRRLRAGVGDRARQAAHARVNGVQLTHIGGPTVLVEVDGWRLLTDPTFDPPGRSYRFGWGTGSRKTAGPGDRRRRSSGRSTRSCSRHDHHADNLDPAGRALLPSAGVVVTTVAGRQAARRRPRARPGAVAAHDARGAGPPVDRGHRDAVPARPAAAAARSSARRSASR